MGIQERNENDGYKIQKGISVKLTKKKGKAATRNNPGCISVDLNVNMK